VTPEEWRKGMEDAMIRVKLIEAREKRGWTQEHLAELVNVDVATIRRWEQGDASPQGRNKWKLMEILEAASEEDLDLAYKAVAKSTPPSLHSLMRYSSVARLIVLISGNDETLDLQCKIRESLERLSMDSLSRREALYTLAALPLTPLLSSLNTEKAADEILRQFAAGITACKMLSNGNGTEMREASKVLADYLPTLKNMAKSLSSSRHRKMAALLTTQASISKAVLATHLTSTKQAATYAKQAVEYAEASGDTGIMISALVIHSWALFRDHQIKGAMEIALQAKHLVEQTKGLSALTCSTVHAFAAEYQAANGFSYKQDALKTLSQARKDFDLAGKSNDKTTYLDISIDILTLADGMTHLYSGDAVSAYEIFSQAIDPDTLQPQIAFSSERLRTEMINNLTLASLKLPGPKRDKERSVTLWKAGLQGAINLHSEQRLNEIATAYHIMEAHWEDDNQIRELRELLVHR
jgi:transcriptional regulator with XRE-family HTH domain